MDKKRILAYAVVTAILAALVYMQFRTWKDFDWTTFWDQSKQVNPLRVLDAIALIYFSYSLRAGKSSCGRCARTFPPSG